MRIICNNNPRKLKYGSEMPEKLRADFDYIESDEFDCHDFFVYKGYWYDLSDFMRIDNSEGTREGWEKFDGYHSDSFFSGILVKVLNDETVLVATYFA